MVPVYSRSTELPYNISMTNAELAKLEWMVEAGILTPEQIGNPWED